MLEVTTRSIPVHTIARDGKTLDLSDDDMMALCRDIRDNPALKALAERAGLNVRQSMVATATTNTPKRLSLKQLTDLVASATAEELPEDVVNRTFLFLSLGLKISAVKSVRERYGLGLKEAKDVVERLMSGISNNDERLEDLLDGSVKRYISEDDR